MTNLLRSECFDFLCGEFYNDSAYNSMGCPRAYVLNNDVLFIWSDFCLASLEDAEYDVKKLSLLESIEKLEAIYKERLEKAEKKIISLKRR